MEHEEKVMNQQPTEIQKDAFFSGLDSGLKSLREVRSAYDQEMAFDFDPLHIFNINENKVSEILAYFLNPKSKHGQKDAFIQTFLEFLDDLGVVSLSDQVRGKSVSISTQYYTEGKRPIDIVITFGDNEFIIGIENKVWGAQDQPKQIQDYIEDIEKKAKDEKSFLMLYLSPYGEGPSKDSIPPEVVAKYKKDKRFQIVPFNQAEGLGIIPILVAFSEVAKADNVRSFLKLLIKYFYNEFIGVIMMDEEKYMLKYLTDSDDRMRLALNISPIVYSDSFRQVILDKQTVQIESAIKSKYEIKSIKFVGSVGEMKTRYEQFCTFALKDWVHAEIFVEFESWGMKNCYYGIRYTGENSVEFLTRVKKARGFVALNPSNCNTWFPTYQNWDGTRTWSAMLKCDDSGQSEFTVVFMDVIDRLIKCSLGNAKELNIAL